MTTFRTEIFACEGPAHSALKQLHELFAQACNYVAPIAAQSRCWSRVGLHHMVYRSLRERFPDLGSQMSCNAIYAVSKVASLAYRAVGRRRGQVEPLPRIEFSAVSPVFFDRHTLSIRHRQLSLYTPVGRIRIEVGNIDEVAGALDGGALKDILLTRVGGGFVLIFMCQEREFEDLQIFNVNAPSILNGAQSEELMPS